MHRDRSGLFCVESIETIPLLAIFTLRRARHDVPARSLFDVREDHRQLARVQPNAVRRAHVDDELGALREARAIHFTRAVRTANRREQHLSRKLTARLRDVELDVMTALFSSHELAEVFGAHEATETTRALLDVNGFDVRALESTAAPRTTKLVRGCVRPREARFTAVRAAIER